MKIQPTTTNYRQNVYQKNTTFGVNLASPKLAYELEDFFVNINGYGKDIRWANYAKKVANQAVVIIRKNAPFEDVIHHIAWGARYANEKCTERDRRKSALTGVLRYYRQTWADDFYRSDDKNIITPYGKIGINKYSLYEDKLDNTINKPINNPYPKISLSRAIEGKIGGGPCNYILHGDADKINPALDYVGQIYDKLQKNYVNKNINKKDLYDINKLIARSRWILAHSTPWHRGSDLIANIYIRSLYKALGIKSYPFVQNVSLDLEAFCTPLSKYIKNFTTYFTQKPEIAE